MPEDALYSQLSRQLEGLGFKMDVMQNDITDLKVEIAGYKGGLRVVYGVLVALIIPLVISLAKSFKWF